MNIQPTGTIVYAEAETQGQVDSRMTENAQLLIPKMDKFPILPDAGHVTDIVSTADEIPWFDQAHPDARPEVFERSCQ